MTEKVTKLALTSRIIMLILQLLANVALPDHKTNVFRAPIEVKNQTTTGSGSGSATTATWLDKSVSFCLGGLRHWDGEYFLHIAEHGYTYENTLAFYPLYPLIVRTGAHTLFYLVSSWMSLRSCILLVAVLINTLLFCKAVNIMFLLTQRVFSDLNKSWHAALLFCFNPAAIFFSATYSETLFAWLTLYLMLECITELRFVRSTMALALCAVTRSNGLVNAGFPVYFLLRKCVLKATQRCTSLLKLFFCILLALIPLTFFNFYAFQQFCLPDKVVAHSPAVLDYGRKQNYVLAGHRQPHHSPWCDENFPFPYSYIQSHYWQVGFMRYYHLKQLPNFLLSLPVLVFLLWHCVKYLRHFMGSLLPKYPLVQLLKEYKSIPFVLHALFLTLFCVFFVHIQISTRLLCSATPCLYWFAADYFPRSLDQLRLRSKAGLIFVWFGSYFVIGAALFSNNFPWT